MKYIAYYRVSTQKQNLSGLGLEAQTSVIKKFSIKDEIIGEYTDIESGRKNNRPELLKAISHAQRENAILIIAKLDRLSRDVNFISGLMKSEVTFIACDQPSANKFTLHIFAALAEQERDLISDRTKAALQALKARGKVLGTPANLTNKARMLGISKIKENAAFNENNLRASAFIGSLRKEGKSFLSIASELNRNGFLTSRGKKFQVIQVQRLFNRMNSL